RNFPRALIAGLSVTGVVYVLISILAVAVVPIGQLTESTTPLLEVVKVGAPAIPIDTIFAFISIFAVANTVLINMMMASRLLYGMAKQGVLPGFLKGVLRGRRTPWSGIIFSTVLAFLLVLSVRYVLAEQTIAALGGTTALLLLAVFGLVNIAVLVLRSDKVDVRHFRTPTVLPVIGALTSFPLISPIAQPTENYVIGGGLLVDGLALYIITRFYNSAIRARRTRSHHPDDLGRHRHRPAPDPARPASPRPEGVPMNTILLAYVPSATSEAALAYAVDEAKRRDASLLVLASERAPDPRKARGVADRRPLEERLAETGLEFELRTVPKRDDPADDILDAIEHDDVLMVVLGIRRRTPIGKILLGSTSQRVAIESPVPVVLVKPEGFVAPARF